MGLAVSGLLDHWFGLRAFTGEFLGELLRGGQLDLVIGFQV
jgi:hypothetical protein